MDRREDKAESMLNSSIALKAEEKKEPKEERSYLDFECDDISHVDKLHQQLMREIGCKFAEIQNEGLGEHRLSDLNIEINRLLYDKTLLEHRVVRLGGPKYAKHSGKMIDPDGNIVDLPNPVVGFLGFGYYGAAAKKIPKELKLFEKPTELRKRRTRDDIYKSDASYYGHRDEVDGVLEREEGPVKKKISHAAEEMRRAAEEMRHAAEEMRRAAEEMRSEAAEEKRMWHEEKKMWHEAEEMRRLRKTNKVVLEMKKMELVNEGEDGAC